MTALPSSNQKQDHPQKILLNHVDCSTQSNSKKVPLLYNEPHIKRTSFIMQVKQDSLQVIMHIG